MGQRCTRLLCGNLGRSRQIALGAIGGEPPFPIRARAALAGECRISTQQPCVRTVGRKPAYRQCAYCACLPRLRSKASLKLCGLFNTFTSARGAIDVWSSDVFAVGTGRDAFHKIAITVALCDLLELDAKFVDPLFVDLLNSWLTPALCSLLRCVSIWLTMSLTQCASPFLQMKCGFHPIDRNR